MSFSTLTYNDLENIFFGQLAKDMGIAPSSFPNMASALTAFLSERRMAPDSVIGSTLRAGFYKARDAHLASLTAEGRPSSYVANRKHLLGKWHAALVRADDQNASAREESRPFQAALHGLVASRGSLKSIATAAGMPPGTLQRWLHGAIPTKQSVRWVPRLEHLFGCTRGALADLLPCRPPKVDDDTGSATLIPYREAQKQAVTFHYLLKDAGEVLKTEWRAFLVYKTSMGAVETDEDDDDELERHANAQWRFSATSRRTETPSTWHSFLRGRHVPSAGIAWSYIAQYLGWLRLKDVDCARTAPGLSNEEAQTLGQLANWKYVKRFCEWRLDQCDGRAHGGILRFLSIVKSLSNPSSGYLAQSGDTFAVRVGVQSREEWQKMCARTHGRALKLFRDCQRKAKRRRNPSDPLESVLAHENPLEEVVDAIRRMEANRPATGGVAEAVWFRDRLLLKLLASNPIRDTNIVTMKYLENGRGHLRRAGDGWSIHIPVEELKNERGAAKDNPYDMPVQQPVWSDIEKYLKVYRPMLRPPAENHYVFVSSEPSKGPWQSLSRHFAQLTRRYLRGCPGVGVQGMRHIVATSILKARPNDWATAAWALHDTEETVRKDYVHLRSKDAQRWFEAAMAKPFSRM